MAPFTGLWIVRLGTGEPTWEGDDLFSFDWPDEQFLPYPRPRVPPEPGHRLVGITGFDGKGVQGFYGEIVEVARHKAATQPVSYRRLPLRTGFVSDIYRAIYRLPLRLRIAEARAPQPVIWFIARRDQEYAERLCAELEPPQLEPRESSG